MPSYIPWVAPVHKQGEVFVAPAPAGTVVLDSGPMANGTYDLDFVFCVADPDIKLPIRFSISGHTADGSLVWNPPRTVWCGSNTIIVPFHAMFTENQRIRVSLIQALSKGSVTVGFTAVRVA